MADILDMRFLVQYGLVEVGNAPALGNAELKQVREFLRGLPGHGVAPGAEGREQMVVLVEREVAVHHPTEADGANGLERDAVLLMDFGVEPAIAFLQACPNIFEVIGPHAVFVAVFPLIASRCERGMVDQHCLDARRTKLDAKNGLSGFNRFLGIVWAHIGVPVNLSFRPDDTCERDMAYYITLYWFLFPCTYRLARSTLVAFDKSGHWPYLEEPERFRQVLGDFLGQ